MTDWHRLERRISQRVPLSHRPVAVTVLDSAPQGVAKFTGTEPSGCSFWRLAAEGRTFYPELTAYVQRRRAQLSSV